MVSFLGKAVRHAASYGTRTFSDSLGEMIILSIVLDWASERGFVLPQIVSLFDPEQGVQSVWRS